MNVYLPLDLLVCQLGKSYPTIKTIARMREVSKELKQRIDHIVINSAIFRACFNNQPQAISAFIWQKEPQKLLHEIWFRLNMIKPREDFEIEVNVADKRKLIHSFQVFFTTPYDNIKLRNEVVFNSLLNRVETPYDLLEYSQEGCTALHYACYLGGSISQIQQLLDKGADINQPSTIGSTAICFAIQKGRRDLVAFLREKGANLDCPEWADRPTLFWIDNLIILRPKEVIPMLQLWQKFGMDIKIQDHHGNTLLHIAALNNCTELIPELVETYQIPVDIRNKKGTLAMALSTGKETLRQFYKLGCRLDEKDHLSVALGSTKLGDSKCDIFRKIPHAIKEIHFKKQTNQENMQSLLYFPYLEKLTFACRGLTDEHLKPLAELNRLRTLYITHIPSHLKGTGFQNLCNLTELSLSGDGSGSIHRKLFDNLMRLKQVRSLTLSSLFDQNQDDWLYLRFMNSLEELQLDDTSITKDQIIYLPPNLKEIYFWRNRHLSDGCMSAMIGLKNLQYLSIVESPEITIKGVKTILNFMPQVGLYIRCNGLEQLRLEYPNRLD